MRAGMNFAPVILFMLVALQNSGRDQSPLRAVAITDIREAVIRYQIKTWELAADSYCVKIEGKAPDKKLLQRLRPLPVKGPQGCRKKKSLGFLVSVIDRKTGKRSVNFSVGKVEWLSEKEVKVEGGYDCGSQCMAFGVYHIAFEGTTWVVTSFEIQIMS